MNKIKRSLLIFIIIILMFLFVGCEESQLRESKLIDTDTIKYSDLFFLDANMAEVFIPYKTKMFAGSSTIFRTEDDILTVGEDLSQIQEPRITIIEQKPSYLILEVNVNNNISRAIVYDITDSWSSARKNQHYYEISGFTQPIETSATCLLCWPLHFFPLYTNSNLEGLVQGKKYPTNATFDDFVAFYDELSKQRGYTYTKTDNTLELDSNFIFNNFFDDNLSVLLTFDEGNVIVEILDSEGSV